MSAIGPSSMDDSRRIGLQHRVLALKLGVGSLEPIESTCKGYSCGCCCLRCAKRASPPEKPQRFPWEMAA